MSGHTPGPWCRFDDEIVTKACDTNIATVAVDLPEMEANAHLIAAAPELLEALKSVEEWLSSFSMPPTSTIAEKQAHLDTIADVIAKAEGR